MKNKIQTRLIIYMLLLTVLVVAFVGLSLLFSMTNEYYKSFEAMIDSVFKTEQFADACTLYINGDTDAIYNFFTKNSSVINGTSDKLYYILYDGNVISAGSRGGIVKMTDNLARALDGRPSEPSGIMSGSLDWAHSLNDSYTFYIVDNRAALKTKLLDISALFLQALALGFIVAAATSFLFARKIAVPIKKLTAQAQKMTGGDFSPLKIKGGGEISRLSEAFNEMGRQLRSEQSKLNSIIEQMNQPMAAFDEEGGIIHANNAYTPEIAKKISLDSDQDMIEANGRVYLVRKGPLTIDDAALASLVVLSDITELEQLESSRRDFVASASHELKTPLTIIKSYSQTLCQNPTDPKTRERFLQIIDNEADHMDKIVRDLLVLAGLESNKDSEWEELDLHALADEIISSYSLEIAKRGLSVKLQGAASLYAPHNYIRRLLVNLFSNAVKFSKDGGEITLNITSCTDKVLLTVEDDGAGIDPIHLPYVFDRFYRADKARSRQTGGTGLGLAIAKEIVSALKGEISVASKAGVFTRFEVMLPK